MLRLLVLEKEVLNMLVYLKDLQDAFGWSDRETIENIDEAIASEIIELRTLKKSAEAEEKR